MKVQEVRKHLEEVLRSLLQLLIKLWAVFIANTKEERIHYWYKVLFILPQRHFSLPRYLNAFPFLYVLDLHLEIQSFSFNQFIYYNWRLITLQYCGGFCHTLKWISHGFAFHAVPSLQSCLTLCDPMDYNPPGSSVHGIFPGKNTGMGWYFLPNLGIKSSSPAWHTG